MVKNLNEDFKKRKNSEKRAKKKKAEKNKINDGDGEVLNQLINANWFFPKLCNV